MIANKTVIFGDNLGDDLSQVRTPMTHQLVSLDSLPFVTKPNSILEEKCELSAWRERERGIVET